MNGALVQFTSTFSPLSSRTLFLSWSPVSRIIVDRYALPENPSSAQRACDPGQQTWCGGTWNSIRSNLDYIQSAGFTASKSSLSLSRFLP